jgi:hypothetical protein
VKANVRCKVKPLSLHHQFVIALHSPDQVFETGLLISRPENKPTKLADSPKHALDEAEPLVNGIMELLDIHWLVADITKATLESCVYDVWHDRTVFHFLIRLEEKKHCTNAGCCRTGIGLRPGSAHRPSACESSVRQRLECPGGSRGGNRQALFCRRRGSSVEPNHARKWDPVTLKAAAGTWPCAPVRRSRLFEGISSKALGVW